MRVVVVGAGKMGLPLACQIADRGAQVVACDINESVVEAINAGECPIDEPGVPEILRRVVGQGRLRASTRTGEAAASADVVIVIVPAVLTPESDIDSAALESVADILAGSIRPGCMVSFETTLPVGGTRTRLLPRLESAGRKAGVDFDLVFSPERVKSQLVMRNLTVNPKVVGGVTPAAAARAAQFYHQYLGAPVDDVGTLEAAELVKLAGMLYRDVNIALANELAGYAEEVGVDLTRLFPAINSDGEAQLLQPGIGVGGHCTPVYPYFLIRDAERRGVPMTLAARSRRVNDDQAAHGLDLLERSGVDLAGASVLVMGLAFRPDVKESIFSTAFLLRAELERRGARVTLADPLYSDEEIRSHGFLPASADDPIDLVVLNTAHAAYREPDFAGLAGRGVRAVLDGRNAWSAEDARAAGLRYVGIGRPLLDADPRPRDLPIARPVLGSDEEMAAADVVRSGWLMQGPQVEALEAEFAAFTGAARACAVSSGTAALHLALLALGIGPGDEVVTVSHSFIATANSVALTGARPVFVDIEPGGFNIDPDRIEAAVTARTRALVVVHQYGMPCDLSAVLEVARRHDLRMVEDAACAIGSEILHDGSWQRIGAPHGDVATFSFHPRKVMTTGEGGMVVARAPHVDAAVRSLRQHGTLAPTSSSSRVTVGLNYRMTDVQAAVGRRQLRRVPAMVAERRRLADRYGELLGGRDPATPAEPSWARSNWQTYCLLLDASIDVGRVLEGLAALGIGARGGIPNAHRQPAFAGHATGPLEHSEAAESRSLCLPLYPGMTGADQERVVAGLLGTIDELYPRGRNV